MNELSSPGRAILSEWGVSQFHGLSTSEGPARSGLKNTGPGRAPGRQVLPPPLVLFTFLTVKAPSLQPPKPTLSPSPTSPLNTLIAKDDWRSPFLRLLSHHPTKGASAAVLTPPLHSTITRGTFFLNTSAWAHFRSLASFWLSC